MFSNVKSENSSNFILLTPYSSRMHPKAVDSKFPPDWLVSFLQIRAVRSTKRVRRCETSWSPKWMLLHSSWRHKEAKCKGKSYHSLMLHRSFVFGISGRRWSEKFHQAIGWIQLEVVLEGARFIQTSRDLGIKVCWFHFSKSSSEEWWFWGVSTLFLKALTDEVHVLRSENKQLKRDLSKACGLGRQCTIISGTKWARRHHSQTAWQTWGASFLNSKFRSEGIGGSLRHLPVLANYLKVMSRILTTVRDFIGSWILG